MSNKKIALGIALLALVAVSVFVLPSLADPKKLGAQTGPQDGTGSKNRNGKGKGLMQSGEPDGCTCPDCVDCTPGDCQCPDCQTGVCEDCECEGCGEQRGNREKFGSSELACPGKGKTQRTPKGQAYGWRKGGWIGGSDSEEPPAEPSSGTVTPTRTV